MASPVTRNSENRYDIVYVPLGAQGYGGAERSLMDLASRFSARGNRVLVLVGPELARTDFVDEAKRRGLATQSVEWTHHRSRWHNLRAAVRTWRGLKARLIHFNISWHPDMWMVALCARALTGARLIGTMRAMPDPHEFVPRRMHFGFVPGFQLWHLPELAVGWMWGRILHCTVTVNARDFSSRLISHYRYPAERVTVIYNGIDVEVPRAARDETLALRQEAGAAENDFLVAFVARLESGKGAEILLQAIAPLPARVRVVIVGDGGLRNKLEEMTDQLELRGRVHFAGYVERPESWMAAADIVCVPSLIYEAFGRVVIEAMNQGTPVIASRVGGMAELFEDGVQGRYVAAGNAADLCSAIDALSLDRVALQQMACRARALVLKQYSLDRVELQYFAKYAQLGL